MRFVFYAQKAVMIFVKIDALFRNHEEIYLERTNILTNTRLYIRMRYNKEKIVHLCRRIRILRIAARS